MIVVGIKKYQHALEQILKKVEYLNVDAIICIKRSGFIMGAYLSNKLDKPLFTQSEISSIPSNMRFILLIDDKIQTGKTFKKIKNRILKTYPKIGIFTATLFVEGEILTDFFVYKMNKRIKSWYE